MSDFWGHLAEHDPVWLDQAGPESDVALWTRAQLSRNLAGFPFPHHASPIELQSIRTELQLRLGRLVSLRGGWDLEFSALSAAQRRVLQEEQLAALPGGDSLEHRGLILGADLSRAARINGEDHVSLSAMGAGFDPRAAVAEVMDLDTEMEAEVTVAFSAEWGYLTASPTTLGTGLRISTVLHLPGLVLVGEIERVLNALRQLQFAVGGLFGQSRTVRGALFQISNLVTLGRDEREIADDFSVHVGKIITYERSARDQLYRRDPLGIEDMVQRSRALLANARIITAQETFDCLSNIRLGEGLGLLPVTAPGSLNRLTVRQQAGHLDLAAARTLSGREKAAARAALLREFFAAK